MADITRNDKAEIKFHKEIDLSHLNNENFHEMLQSDDMQSKLMENENSIVSGKVIRINKDYVLLDVGLKSEGQVPLREFTCGKDEDVDLSVGDQVNVYLTKIEGYGGSIVLSRENAIRYELWDKLRCAYEANEDIDGTIVNKIKSGYIVDLGLIAAFLPNSHVDLKPVKDISPLLNKKIKFRILKMDREQGNIVVSRRVIIDSLHAQSRKEFLATLTEGQVLEGLVKSITNYGVFVGLFESPKVGIIDGLLHITDISWNRISHPSAVYSNGETIQVKIIKIDHELGRISLGRKQLTTNPWDDVDKKYPIMNIFTGRVTSIEEYGIFVELEAGIEGLVHASEISWTNDKLSFTQGDTVQIMVLSIDTVKNRMSLSIKQCNDNPWKKFLNTFPLGSTVKCKVNSVNLHSGMNVKFPDYHENISGFIYSRDMSWDDNYMQLLKKYKSGDIVNAKVLRINALKGGVFLGIKQIEYDPFMKLLDTVKIGDKVGCAINKIDDNGIYITIKSDIDRFIERHHLLDMSSLAIGERIDLEVREIGKYNLILTNKPKNDDKIGN